MYSGTTSPSSPCVHACQVLSHVCVLQAVQRGPRCEASPRPQSQRRRARRAPPSSQPVRSTSAEAGSCCAGHAAVGICLPWRKYPRFCIRAIHAVSALQCVYWEPGRCHVDASQLTLGLTSHLWAFAHMMVLMCTILMPAGAEDYKKTIVRPRADQLTSTYTSAQLADRYGYPILTQKTNRRALALHSQCQSRRRFCSPDCAHLPGSPLSTLAPSLGSSGAGRSVRCQLTGCHALKSAGAMLKALPMWQVGGDHRAGRRLLGEGPEDVLRPGAQHSPNTYCPM